MRTCDACEGAGEAIVIERGAVHVYRYSTWCRTCRGRGIVPDTDGERVEWLARIYREDVMPRINRSAEEPDDGELA